MVDVRGDVLRPPHGTTPAAVKSNIKSKMRSFKSNENIHKKEGGSYYLHVFLLSLAFGQSLPKEIKDFLFPLSPRSLGVFERKKSTLSKAANPQSFKLFWLQSHYLTIKMPYFGFSFTL